MRLSIVDCGAVADGVTKCTDAINETIAKVAEAGGGYAVVPPGEYVSGTIFLKSNVYLWLEPGATILGSMDVKDFSRPTKRMPDLAMVVGEDLENTGILGHGTLNLRRQRLGYTSEHGRPCLVLLVECKNITLRGVSLINTGFFTIYSVNNTNATFDSLIINSEYCENGDGIDFSGSKNVTISNCKIRAWDDAIGLKTHYGDAPCENFTITNCVLSSMWAGIRMGPETCGDMLNITVSNCVFNDCSDGVKIQLCENYRMEDLTFSNLNMTNVLRAFFMTSNSYPMSCASDGCRPAPGVFKRVLISNVIAHMNTRAQAGWFENQILINGLPNAPIEDLMISNIHVVAPGGKKADTTGASAETPELLDHAGNYPDLLFDFPPYPSSCMYIKNAARVKLYNCVFETAQPDERPAIVAESVDGMKITQAEVYNTAGLLRHYRVNDLKIVNCEGEVSEPNDDYKARWDAFRAMSLDMEKQIDKNAKLVDKVRKMDRVFYTLTPNFDELDYTFTFDHKGGEAYLYLNRVSGNLRVIVNGKEVYYWKRDTHPSYSFRVPLAVDLTDAIVAGENTVTFKIEGEHPGLGDRRVAVMVPKEG